MTEHRPEVVALLIAWLLFWVGYALTHQWFDAPKLRQTSLRELRWRQLTLSIERARRWYGLGFMVNVNPPHWLTLSAWLLVPYVFKLDLNPPPSLHCAKHGSVYTYIRWSRFSGVWVCDMCEAERAADRARYHAHGDSAQWDENGGMVSHLDSASWVEPAKEPTDGHD